MCMASNGVMVEVLFRKLTKIVRNGSSKVVKQRNFLCAELHTTPWRHMKSSGATAPSILNLNSSRKWQVSFSVRPLYSRYLIYCKLGRPRTGWCCREEGVSFLLLPEMESQFLGRPMRSLFTAPTELSLSAIELDPNNATCLNTNETVPWKITGHLVLHKSNMLNIIHQLLSVHI